LSGLILSKRCAYTKICVRPYEHNIKYIKLMVFHSPLNNLHHHTYPNWPLYHKNLHI
jgi:hypothetical protein